MLAGSVTIDQTTGAATGDGMALAIYTADLTTTPLDYFPTCVVGQTTPPFTPDRPAAQADVDNLVLSGVKFKTEMARKATAYASGIVTHIASNAKATISVGTSCGRLPTTLTAGTAIDPPVYATDLWIS